MKQLLCVCVCVCVCELTPSPPSRVLDSRSHSSLPVLIRSCNGSCFTSCALGPMPRQTRPAVLLPRVIPVIIALLWRGCRRAITDFEFYNELFASRRLQRMRRCAAGTPAPSRPAPGSLTYPEW